MTGYSSNTLSKKLGIKEGYIIYVENAPVTYKNLLEPIPEHVIFTESLQDNLDMIHFFTKQQKELKTEIKKHIKKIKQNGQIWISWPKKASKVETDITEDVIREIILPLGLVDIKVCAVDEIWSGLKLVIRKENRKSA